MGEHTLKENAERSLCVFVYIPKLHIQALEFVHMQFPCSLKWIPFECKNSQGIHVSDSLHLEI